MDEMDIYSLFGNLLNNAIEACQGQKDPWLRVSCGPVKSYLAIEVENSVSGDIMKENPTLSTTKKDSQSHGIGLRILKRIAEQYNGVLHYEMKGSDCFSVQLLLNLEES